MKRRIIAAAASAALGVAAIGALATPASASALCSFSSYGHTTAIAYTTGNGYCIQVSARATLSIPGGGTVYTSTVKGTNYAEAQGSPYVVGGRHGQQPFTNQWIYVNS